MAKLYGFNLKRATALNRVADREGVAPRTNGGRTRYATPIFERGVWIGKADAAIASGASGTVSIWTGTPGSETDSTENLTSCFNRTGLDIDSGSWVRVMEINGHLYVEPWECPS